MNARWMWLAAAIAPQAFGQTTAFQSEVAQAGPTLWYQFNELNGNLINHGSLGAGFDAVPSGDPIRGVPGANGDAATGFTAGRWFESLGLSPLTGNPTFSIEAVIRLDSNGPAGLWGPFLHWGDGGPTSRTGREVYFSVQHGNNARLYAGFYNAGVRTVSSVSQDEWLHYVWVREGGNDSDAGSTLFINGAPFSSELDTQLNPGFVAAGGITVQSSRFRINQAQDFGDARFFTGAIDELALYDRLLTQEEIARRAGLIRCVGDIADDFGSPGGDGMVGFGDFLALLGLVGTCPGGSPGCRGDIADDFGTIGGDGMVSFGDFLALLGLVGPCP